MQAHCQCGALQASITDDVQPTPVLCHCDDCQRRSGSPFGVIAYYPDKAVTVSGEAREYRRGSYAGTALTNGFCPQCGSTVYVLLEKAPALIGVPVGAFADPTFPAPVRAVWAQHRHPWVSLPDDIPSFARGTDGR
tara:strand:+ start:858 stop:1265 length:408 start_codon:yes stop_codon:yes gene_type:complete